MGNSKQLEWQNAEDDFEVEITDLDQTGNTGYTQSWLFAERFLNWQRSIGRRRWRLIRSIGISLLLISFLTLSGLSSFLANIVRTSLIPNRATQLLLSSVPSRPAQQDGLSCLVDAAWAPGSKYIAVVGYRLNCPQSASVASLVNVYNVSTGKLLHQLLPDSAILRAFNAYFRSASFINGRHPNGWRAYDNSIQRFYYSHLLWSPDGHRLALTFSTTTFAPRLNGVLLMNIDGTQAHVLLQPQKPTNPFYAEWDLKNRVAVNMAPVSPALSYRWGTAGSLIPLIPLTNNSVPPSSTLPDPVGNPTGSATFTVWQSGFADWMLLEHESSVYTWSTDFAAWSPDGRYLVDGIGLRGLLSQPGFPLPSQQSLMIHHLNQQPLLPAHDVALLRVATLYSAVAWRPDGHVLAAYNSADSVELYDCITGHRIGILLPHSKNSFVDGSTVLLRWSPDGTQLLLSSVQWGLVTVWGQVHRIADSPF